jgi:hypothetical protein
MWKSFALMLSCFGQIDPRKIIRPSIIPGYINLDKVPSSFLIRLPASLIAQAKGFLQISKPGSSPDLLKKE